MRSIARVLTSRRRSTRAPSSWFGSLWATSRRVCVIASGVRSSWEALAANRCCSPTCASSRARSPSTVSARSFSSSSGPGEREALVQVALGDLPRRRRHRAQGAQDPAGDQPAERDRDRGHDRQHDPGLDEPLVETVAVTFEGRGVHFAHIAGEVRVRQNMVDGARVGRPPRDPGRDDQVDPGVAAEELGRSSRAAPFPRRGIGRCRAGSGADARSVRAGGAADVARAWRARGGASSGRKLYPRSPPSGPVSGWVAMRYPTPATVAMIAGSPRRLRSAETVMRTALVNGSACSSHACCKRSSALTTPPSAATRTSRTANCLRVSAT